MTDQADEALAKLAQNGDSGAFSQLVLRYEQKILRYARKFLFGYQEAEDLAQEVFLKAFVNLRSFDTDRRFSPWIYRIAHNEFINAIKKKGKEPLPFFDADAIFPHPLSKEDPAKDTDIAQTKIMLDKCLSKLDPKYREPLVLFFFEDMDYKQIADILRIPMSTAGVRIKRGKERLKEIFSNIKG